MLTDDINAIESEAGILHALLKGFDGGVSTMGQIRLGGEEVPEVEENLKGPFPEAGPAASGGYAQPDRAAGLARSLGRLNQKEARRY